MGETWLVFAYLESVQTALHGLEYIATGLFKQIVLSPSRVVLEVLTNKGLVNVMCTNGYEGALTRCIAKFAPSLVRDSLYVNEDEGSMLM